MHFRSLLSISLIVLFFSTSIFAWNSVGHRVVAQIAYDNLTPIAKQKIDTLTAVDFNSPYPEQRFTQAATWPDFIKKKNHDYDTWHYVDYPIDNNANVVWAISEAQRILNDKNQNEKTATMYLNFLIHFVGDIHQPLHCGFKKDEGGNLYRLKGTFAKDLHQFWDEGLGLFYSHAPKPYPFHYWEIEAIAKKWEAQFPVSFFKNQLQEKSPSQWALDNHQIDSSFVYQTPEDADPSQTYIQNGQLIVQKNTVLAGYRLANILNEIFS